MDATQFKAKVRELRLAPGVHLLLKFGPSWNDVPAVVQVVSEDLSWFEVDRSTGYFAGKMEYRRQRITPDNVFDFRLP